MQLFHTSNRLSAAVLVPALALAVKTALGELVDARLSLPSYFGANAGLKVTALVAGMLAGAEEKVITVVLQTGMLRLRPAAS
ncbi:hypothetical protein SAMN05216274_12434 [Cryobacterium levicorallinum]|uniref:Uncharacterized protein n=1 Tax=Cryobacterium levicorallinum TaxID=995038 RepID=A0ABY1EIC0_9MICO|nr:hypothetical protein SAMN05216274_12434 [Cryobacterium levicorallinum]